VASGNTGIVAGITQVVSNVYKHNKQIRQRWWRHQQVH